MDTRGPSSGLRSSPTPEGLCWLVYTETPTDDLYRVAILTDPGGTVLVMTAVPVLRAGQSLRSSPTPEGRCWQTERRASSVVSRVAILTDPGGTVLACGLPERIGGAHVGCDPHRPRRDGAG